MRVLVVGAGIGGLGAAVALRQKGHDVDLVEVKPEMSVYGVGINQPGNSLRALQTLGVLDECLAAGFRIDSTTFYDHRGTVVVDIPSALGGDGVPPNVALSRADLHRALVGRSERLGLKVAYGTRLGGFTDLGDRVEVVLSDGREESYDLVLGFDGITSHLRRELFGRAAEPVYSGFGVFRFTLPRPADVVQTRVYQAAGVKVGFIPLSPASMYMFMVTPQPERMTVPAEQYGDYLRGQMAPFEDLPGRVRDAITGPEGIVYSPISDVLLPSPWFRGRLGVLGDGAHACAPHLTQGAGMALEDGVVLADVLDGPGPLPEQLQRFSDRRYPRAKFVQDVSRQILLSEMAITADNYEQSFEMARLHLPDQMRAVDEFLNTPA